MDLDRQADIAALDSTLTTVERVLDVEGLRARIAKLEDEASDPKLWDDQANATRDQLVAGYRAAIRAAHERGLRVLLGTLTPQNGTLQPGYGATANPTRLAVNRWIRAQRLADGVVDFDRAVRDPADPNRIRPEYDGGDHLHFSAAGYRALAAAVPLHALARPACR